MWSIDSQKQTIFALEHFQFVASGGYVRFKKKGREFGSISVLNVVRKVWLMKLSNSADVVLYESLKDLIDDGWVLD